MRSATLVFLSLLVCGTPVAQAGTWGERGVSKRFVVSGDLLYAADGRGVTVYDVSNAAAMRRVDVESGIDESFDLARMGATDLVLATRGGVDRFAIAADGTLSRSGRWTRDGGATLIAANAQVAAAASNRDVFLLVRDGTDLEQRGVVVFGNAVKALAFTATHLFVAVENEGIHVIDPDTTAEVALISRPADALALSGSTLWAGSATGGLVAIDVHDAQAPQILSTTGLGTIVLDGVAAAGTRVYGYHAPDTITFFDATDVRAPRATATRTEWVNVIGAGGSTVFFSGPRLDRDKYTYETGLPVRAFDATDPASPRPAGSFTDLAGPVSGVWTDGSLAYVVDAPFFRVLDVSKTDDPQLIGSIELPYAAPQLRMRVKNGIALVYGRDYVHLIDVTDPVRPRLKTTWNPRGHSPDEAALMADGIFVELNDHSGIHVVNYEIYDPPVQVGGRISHWHSVAAGDDAIYALGGYLLTMSVTDRARVKDVSVVTELAQRADTAPPNVDRPPYLALVQGTGVRLYDLTEDRFHPKEIASVNANAPGQMATAADSLVVDVGGTLKRLEFSHPTELVPTDMRVTSAMQISMAGEKVVVADRYRVRVFGPDTAPPPSLSSSKRRSVRR